MQKKNHNERIYIDDGVSVGIEDASRMIKILELNPLIYFKDVLNIGYFPEPLRKVAKHIVNNQFTLVKAGHGIGKSFLAASLVRWYLNTHWKANVYTTAPTHRQVYDILWKEIKMQSDISSVPLEGKLLQTKLKLDEDWLAVGFSSRDGVSYQGRHAKYLFWVIDEADGIDRERFEAILSTMSGKDNRLLAIGNPVDPDSYFRKLQDDYPEHTFEISSYESPNIIKTDDGYKDIDRIPGCATLSFIKQWERSFGKDSDEFKSRVLGQYPTQGERSLASREQVGLCDKVKKEEADWVIMGIDPAYEGTDKTVFTFLSGNTFHKKYAEYSNKTGKELLQEVITWERYFKQVENKKLVTIVWDRAGIATALTERLQDHYLESKVKLLPINFASSPTKFRVDSKLDFIYLMLNKRAEMHFDFRRLVRGEEIYIPKSWNVGSIASKIKYMTAVNGMFKIEPKEKIRKKLGHSPDLLDSMILTIHAKILGHIHGQVELELVYS